MEYGLIGSVLGHSFSKPIHEAVGGYTYELHPLPTEEEARWTHWRKKSAR